MTVKLTRANYRRLRAETTAQLRDELEADRARAMGLGADEVLDKQDRRAARSRTFVSSGAVE